MWTSFVSTNDLTHTNTLWMVLHVNTRGSTHTHTHTHRKCTWKLTRELITSEERRKEETLRKANKERNMLIQTHTHTHTHTLTHTHSHTHTHTHTHTLSVTHRSSHGVARQAQEEDDPHPHLQSLWRQSEPVYYFIWITFRRIMKNFDLDSRWLGSKNTFYTIWN